MDRRIITYGGYFERFMKELTQKEQQKIKYGLLLLKSQEKISTRFVKYIRDGIYELRTLYNGNIFRVFFIFDDGNIVVFYGSPNESQSGYKNNYEKIRVVKSWVEAETDSVADECREFKSLWDGTNPFIKTYNYKESAKANILEVINTRKNASKNAGAAPIKLRDYQEQAINAWINNDYHGFYVMATGTGKTWTAIFSAKKLVEEHPAMIVICAPYKHLVKQWADDVEKAFPNAKLIMVSSENPSWETQISQEIIRKQYKPENQIIVISTIASFKMARFSSVINKSTEEKLLIVDEAHRFTDRPDELKTTFKYMLGLSATPFSGTSAQKGLELMEWFGGQVFNLPIENALDT